MYTFTLNKLVRDKILQHMQTDKFQLDSEVLNDIQYIQALKDKLIEESHEVHSADNTSELIDELADVMEVISSLICANKITMEQIIEHGVKKKKERGGFEGRNKVHSIKLNEKNDKHTKWIEYFISKPNKYPVIKI